MFRRVALPLAAPVVALVGFFSFVANWNNYFLPFVMLPQSDQFPVQVGLGTLLDDVPRSTRPSARSRSQRPELALATAAGDHPGAGRLPVLPALPGRRHARRRHQGLTDAPRTHAPSATPPASAACGYAPCPNGDLPMHPVITASVPLLEPPGWAIGAARAVRPARPRLAPVRPRLHRPGRAAALQRPAHLPRRRGRLLRGLLQLAPALPARRRRRPAGRSPSGTGRASPGS